MMEFANHVLDWLISSGPKILWAGLAVSLLFAMIHLLTMLVTSWGDRKASSKSLLCSLLIHLCCAFGIVVVNPPDAKTKDAQSPADETTHIRNVSFEPSRQRRPNDTGNTPVWEETPEQVEMELARLEHVPRDIEPLASPERNTEEPVLPEMDLPDLPTLPDHPTAAPQPENRGDPGPRIEVARLTKIEETTAESRPEVVMPSPARSRQVVERTPPAESERLARRPSRGDVDRLRPEFDSPVQLASIDADPDPSSLLKRGPIAEEIRQRIGPAPSGIKVDEIGEVAETTSRSASGGGNAPPSAKRLASRSPQTQPQGGVERFRPSQRPQSPQPLPGPLVAVRSGVPVDVPRAGAVPNVKRPNFDADLIRPRASLPATYRGRDRSRRKEIVFQAGGTVESERAVELSLRWLAANQSAEGFWNADAFGAGRVKIDEQGVDRRYAGKQADTGITGLAVLAFLAAAYTHEEGEYADNVERALLWLIRQQDENGYLGGEATHYARHYCHAMATYALAEAYALQSDPTSDLRLREPIRRAVAYIVSTQNTEDGGWRYLKGQKSDMSMFGWQLMALKSAELAGIPTPEATKEKMIQFLKDRSLGRDNGLAGYRSAEPPTPSMTAEALFCKQMLGIRRDNPASIEAAAYLLQNRPRRARWNLYYWYYGNLSMIQYGGDAWREWNDAVRDVLVAEQIKTGSNAGSWDPKGPWGPYGGRVYSTAMAALCLEVYARYLPLYQIGEVSAAR